MYCLFCEKSLNTGKKYCSVACQGKHKQKRSIENWLVGDLVGWKGKTRQLKDFVKAWLHTTRGTCCEVCGWDEKHPVDGAILTEIDHIDGDAENCSPDNLKILCPNCHSKTPTHRNRNKDSKRLRC